MAGLFADTVRDPAELTASALAVIDRAFAAGARVLIPLLSGGHDSHTVCHVASQHPRFNGMVHHINTGIGAKATRQHVEEICEHHGWTLKVWQSNFSYERYVRRLGFPGPGSHQWVYCALKDRCVSKMCKGIKAALVTGCRSAESSRRMGHVEPLAIGETSKRTGKVTRKNRFWLSPCHDWSTAEQQAYMDEHDLPRNPVKLALGMSGECFCGAFASPGEYSRIRVHCPDVADEIDRLAKIARECGVHDKWGERPPKQKGLLAVESGPLCSSCDLRAKAAGVLFV